MRVVETDNFDGDYPDESFLIHASVSEEDAKIIAEIMNRNFCGPHGQRYWKVVGNDYELQPGFEP